MGMNQWIPHQSPCNRNLQNSTRLVHFSVVRNDTAVQFESPINTSNRIHRRVVVTGIGTWKYTTFLHIYGTWTWIYVRLLLLFVLLVFISSRRRRLWLGRGRGSSVPEDSESHDYSPNVVFWEIYRITFSLMCLSQSSCRYIYCHNTVDKWRLASRK